MFEAIWAPLGTMLRPFGAIWDEKWKFKGPSKLPAANSRSGSTEGHGANGNLFATGVLSVVCGFASKLNVKKAW